MSSRGLRLAIVLTVCTGCGAPTIDTSSEEAWTVSTERVRSSLPETERATFDEALAVIAFAGLDFSRIMEEGLPDERTLTADVKRRLEGRTANQVLALADSIQEAQRQEELRQVEEELAELQEKRDEAEVAKAHLARFEITRSRFSQRRDHLGMTQPIIDLAVRNATDHAISRAYFRGTLASPGRSVPWLREEFNYSIRGGLEPRESATWTLAPNMFGPWGDVDAPADAILTVEVVRLDGPDGEPLFAQPFTDWDAERLDGLLEARRRLIEAAPQ